MTSPKSELYDEACAALEAMLFVSDAPVPSVALAGALDLDGRAVSAALRRLRDRLDERGSGLVLCETAGGWSLRTHPRHHGALERFVGSGDARRLSRAALETLAVVAYLQPATRARVAYARGVNSDSALRSLVDKGLVREAGKDERSPGQPMLYATTREFLEQLGLKSLDELPDPASFAPDAATEALIRERLGSPRPVSDAAAHAPDGPDGEESYSHDG